MDDKTWRSWPSRQVLQVESVMLICLTFTTTRRAAPLEVKCAVTQAELTYIDEQYPIQRLRVRHDLCVRPQFLHFGEGSFVLRVGPVRRAQTLRFVHQDSNRT
jgi:hypothetical protein